LNTGNKTYPLQLTVEYKQQQEVIFWTYAVLKPMTGKEYDRMENIFWEVTQRRNIQKFHNIHSRFKTCNETVRLT
jgi:hypothetical protein